MTTETVDTAAMTADEKAVIDTYLESHYDELIAFRRRLHAHPELSGKEYATTESVITRLVVANLIPEVLPSGTGVVCDVASRGSAIHDIVPTVALRADLDALAMDDETETSYKSTVPGVAHCCGHDIHTTVVLGAGLLLVRLLNLPGAPNGRVRLIFEPSEEAVPGGAVEVVDRGFINDVGAIFGLHCDPKTDVGYLGVTSGPITSAADVIEIEITGPGGHTARPERTVDLVSVAARIALDVPRLLAEATVDAPVRLVFGSLRAGDAPNVIPSSARLRGTMRTKDRQGWRAAPKLLKAALDQVVGPTGANWRLAHRRGVPPVVNDVAATDMLASASRSILGAPAVVPTEQSWGGDTFAWYLEQIPGAYARLGTHDPGSTAPRFDLHASTFDVDEAAIGVGVRVLVSTALAWLREEERLHPRA